MNKKMNKLFANNDLRDVDIDRFINFTKINRNSALYTMPMMYGTNSRLTAKQNDTEVADSH